MTSKKNYHGLVAEHISLVIEKGQLEELQKLTAVNHKNKIKWLNNRINTVKEELNTLCERMVNQ